LAFLHIKFSLGLKGKTLIQIVLPSLLLVAAEKSNFSTFSPIFLTTMAETQHNAGERCNNIDFAD
jgi:hypothetical protein